MLSLFVEVFFIGVPVESALPPQALFLLIHLLLCLLKFKDFHDLLVLVFDGVLDFVA
jgi:hypothetical protein